jgi:ABC-type transport system involved in cytochrome bd biosynthesis fused ATPase/permease subunit
VASHFFDLLISNRRVQSCIQLNKETNEMKEKKRKEKKIKGKISFALTASSMILNIMKIRC